MAYLRKRKTKKGFVYDIDCKIDGKRRQISTHTSDRETAQIILMEVQKKIALAVFGVRRKEPILLSLFFDKYFKDAMTFKKASVIRNERNYASKFVKFLGDRDISLIDIRALDAWKVHILNDLGLVPTTYNIERRFLHAAFNKAVRWAYLPRNPVSELQKLKVEERRNFFKDDELDMIFDLIEKDIHDPTKAWNADYNKLYKKYLEFLVNTGLRRNEALSLKLSDLDLEHNTIHVENTKSKKSRRVQMNKKVRSIIRELGDNLFNDLRINTVSHKFNDITSRVGLIGFKLHSLRHTFATRLIQRGIDIYTVKELLGHSDIRTTLVYAKSNIQTLQKAVDTLSDSEEEL